MEQTNMSVPKANTDSDESKKMATGVGAKAGATAGKGLLLAQGGSMATRGISALIDKIAKGVGNLVDKTFGAAGKAVTSAVHHAVSTVTGVFGSASAAAVTTVTTFTTIASVSVSAVAGVSAATGGNNTAIFTDFASYAAQANNDDCSAVGSGSAIQNAYGTSDGKAKALGSDEQQKNAYIIYNTLKTWIETKLNSKNAENQAYGILANMYRESGMNPASIETGTDIGPTDYNGLIAYTDGIGLVQWTGSDCHKDLARFFKNHNMEWNSLDAQLALIVSQKDPLTYRTLEYIESTADASDTECDVEFLSHYERPAAQYEEQRKKEAASDIATVRLAVATYAKKQSDGNADSSQINGILDYTSDVTNGNGSDGQTVISSSMSNLLAGCAANGANGALAADLNSITEVGKRIATAAIKMAWPTKDQAFNNGTDTYKNVYDTIIRDGTYYKACDRLVSCAIGWSGVDDKCVKPVHGGVEGLYSYFTGEGKERWVDCGKVEFDENGKAKNCLPGDVLLVREKDRVYNYGAGHVKIYTGTELIKQLQPNATEGADCVAASMGSRSAGCEIHTEPGYTIYRCVSKEISLVFANADQKKIDNNAQTIPASSLSSTTETTSAPKTSSKPKNTTKPKAAGATRKPNSKKK